MSTTSTLAPGNVKDLTRKEYELFRKLVYESSGINLGDQKMQLVRARLGKRIRQGKFTSFRDYYNHVKADKTGEELCSLLDAISTNTTHLFREIKHFEFIDAQIKRWLADKKWRQGNRELRIWSAACSSGEEPHSVVMTAHNALRSTSGVGVRILATDISTRMLARAKAASYEVHRVGTVPPDYKRRYLRNVRGSAPPTVELVPELRTCIKYARFNLMMPSFPFRHGFHLVFCRNVMIYFDRPTQESLVGKIARHLRPGGYLMIGHSESLSNIDHPLTYVEPTIYRRD